MTAPTSPSPDAVVAQIDAGPALEAFIRAIVDALAEFGVEHIDLPATPERVWRAIRDASMMPKREPNTPRAPGSDSAATG